MRVFQTVTIAVSVMTLCAISVERWYAICHPLKFHSTVQRARIIIIVIWSIAVAVALPEGISAIVVVYADNGTTQLMCFPGLLAEDQIQILQIFLMITFYFVPLSLMGYMYISIAIVLSKKRIPGINYKGKKNSFVRKLPTRFDTNRTVQPQKTASCLIFRIEDEEGLHMYFLCSENKL